MRKTTMMTAGVLLAASLLSGCGGGDGDKTSSGGGYCATMKKAASEIKAFTADDANPDFSKFQDFIDKAQELADEAPSEIKDDWKVVLGAMDDLTSALDDAGISIAAEGGRGAPRDTRSRPSSTAMVKSPPFTPVRAR